MEANGIVPDVIDKVPEKLLSVSFPGNKNVILGNELTPTEVKEQPIVKWESEFSKYYTLVMVDLDVPSRENHTLREVNHWLVVNILNSDIGSGEVITEYLSSGPSKNSGLHRYVFLVYEQSRKLEFDEPKTSKLSRAHRPKFSIKKFAEKYGLKGPIAGNFYQAQWDSYVDIRNQNLTN